MVELYASLGWYDVFCDLLLKRLVIIFSLMSTYLAKDDKRQHYIIPAAPTRLQNSRKQQQRPPPSMALTAYNPLQRLRMHRAPFGRHDYDNDY